MKWLLLLLVAGCHAPVKLTFLGAAGWQLSDGKRVVLVDPFYTRAHTGVPDEAAIRAHVPARVDYVLVTHSHADHLLDAPVVAKLRGAAVIGSESTMHVAHAFGVETALPVAGGEDLQLDEISVRVIPGLHSRINKYFGAHTVIPDGVKLPMREEDFVEGGTFDYLVRMSGEKILIINSANYIERELIGLRPDVLIVAVGLREKIHDYTCRLMRILGRPRLVLMSHFDGTYGPPRVDEDDRHFPEEVHACAPFSTVILPEAFHTY